MLITFTTSNSYHGNIRWESQHNASIGHAIKAFSGRVATNSIRLIATAGDYLVPRPHLFRLIRRHQASQLDRLPNVSDNKYPRIDVRAKNEVVLVRAEAAPRDYEKHSVPKSGAHIKRANAVNRFLKRRVRGIVDVW